jgi:hypothetical protein
VERRRADRPVADHRSGHQRRLSVAGDPVLPLQDAERRRPCGHEAPSDHVRTRSRQPAALQEVRRRADGRRRPCYNWAGSRDIHARKSDMCNLYSITTNQAAIIALFRVVNRYVGNLAPMPGVFPDYKAPIVRNAAEGRELATARWGMPSSSKALMRRPNTNTASICRYRQSIWLQRPAVIACPAFAYRSPIPA